MPENITSLTKNLLGKVLPGESLASYTSWRVGGPADWVYIPANLDDLTEFLRMLPSEIPVSWLGLGSNTLVRDGGIDGVVIITQGALGNISQTGPYTVRAEAGVSCAQIARYTARLGLTGLEFMAGIPGTVGGSLAMNAGCYGGETWERVSQVETLKRDGTHQMRTPQEYEIAYRHVKGPANEWFVAGHFL
jgi:UDP-N-acetylmuramate dehydrogenase